MRERNDHQELMIVIIIMNGCTCCVNGLYSSFVRYPLIGLNEATLQ